jgi:aminoglycoside 6'-N-acetyltransferase
MKIDLRPATLADLKVLQYWDKQLHVLAADPNDDWGWEVELDRAPDWREQLIAEINGRPIRFIQIIDPAREDSHYWIGEKSDLGKGYGTQMMKLALNRCFSNSLVTAVLVDPLANNTRAHRFYERFGFKFLDRRQFGSDDCFVYSLKREDWQN